MKYLTEEQRKAHPTLAWMCRQCQTYVMSAYGGCDGCEAMVPGCDKCVEARQAKRRGAKMGREHIVRCQCGKQFKFTDKAYNAILEAAFKCDTIDLRLLQRVHKCCDKPYHLYTIIPDITNELIEAAAAIMAE